MSTRYSLLILLLINFAASANTDIETFTLLNTQSISVTATSQTPNTNSVRVVTREASVNRTAIEALIANLEIDGERSLNISLPAISGSSNADLVEYQVVVHRRLENGAWILKEKDSKPANSDLVLTLSPNGELGITVRDTSGSMTILQKSGSSYVMRSTIGIPNAHNPFLASEQRPSLVSEQRPIANSGNTSSLQSQTTAQDPSNEVDLLVVTTSAAISAAGGAALLNNSIEAAITETNLGFDESNIDLQIRLAHIATTTYIETNQIALDQSRLRNTNDGYLDEVHALRDQHAADLVMLVIGEGDQFCGYATWGTNGQNLVSGFGFSVIAQYCIPTTVFAHELGHNFGLQHDRFTNNSGGFLPYAHGYTAPSEDWFTIMAYPNGCNFNCYPLNRWSSPDQQLNGEALGAPIGSPTSADNVSALEITKGDVANFRVSSTTPPPSAELNLHLSCLAGLGRVDLNIVNSGNESAEYRLEFQNLSARAIPVDANSWARLRLTGRPPGEYDVVVKKDGSTVLTTSVDINCSATAPPISSPEITPLSTCSGSNGLVLFQFINPTASARSYVIEFEGVSNRSTSAAPFGQSIRGTSGRPDGNYDYLVRSGSTLLESGQVAVNCD